MEIKYLKRERYTNTNVFINGKYCPILYDTYILKEEVNSVEYIEIKYSYCKEGNIFIPYLKSCPYDLNEISIINNVYGSYFKDVFDIRLKLEDLTEFENLTELLINKVLEALNIEFNKLEVENVS